MVAHSTGDTGLPSRRTPSIPWRTRSASCCAGVSSSAATITAVGGVVLLHTRGGSLLQFGEFAGPEAATSTVTGIVRGALHGDGAALIQAGLLVLIATPVSRVIMLLIGFWRERRWLYVLLSAIVLGALTTSLLQTR